jgi:hypothetical protein
MSSPLEISSLQKIMVKPVAWRMTQHLDETITLEFTYVDPIRVEWAPIMTRRAGQKRYKTADAALKDIARVQTEALIYAFLRAE